MEGPRPLSGVSRGGDAAHPHRPRQGEFAAKAGRGELDVTFDDHLLADVRSADRLLEIDDALDHLAQVAPRLARVVECRFYGGLSEEETAEALQVTVRTIQRDWAKARALLQRTLAG